MNASSYDPKRDPRIMHFIEASFGTQGVAFIETDPAKADYESTLLALLSVDHPTRVIQVIVDEGLSRDLSEDVAVDLVERTILAGGSLPKGVFRFCRDHNNALDGFVKLQDGDLWTAEQADEEDITLPIVHVPNEHSTLHRGGGGVL